MQIITVGPLQVSSGKIIVSDPSFAKGNKWQTVVKKVKPGLFNSFLYRVDDPNFGMTSALLLIQHESAGETPLREDCQLFNDEVCVDSGRVGFFDSATYANNAVFRGERLEKPEKSSGVSDDNWYMNCLAVPKSMYGTSLIPGGVLSVYGLGAGTFSCYVARDDAGEAVMLALDLWNDAEVCRETGIPYVA